VVSEMPRKKSRGIEEVLPIVDRLLKRRVPLLKYSAPTPQRVCRAFQAPIGLR
jgi:hypothetical protein